MYENKRLTVCADICIVVGLHADVELSVQLVEREVL